MFSTIKFKISLILKNFFDQMLQIIWEKKRQFEYLLS